MLSRSAANSLTRCGKYARRPRPSLSTFRPLSVLAIETSCDDTSVTIVDYQSTNGDAFDAISDSTHRGSLRVDFHKKVTANNDAYTGIHPLVALASHRTNLAPLIQKAISTRRRKDCQGSSNEIDTSAQPTWRPDLIAVTRGPGMRSNLATGLDTAKGLAMAFNVPLVGVHHMQAHALTPRLVAAMDSQREQRQLRPMHPAFPFLTVLASGGHTMLVDSASLVEHSVLAETADIAIGAFLDKAARVIMPPEHLKHPLGRALEHFAFGSDVAKPSKSAGKDHESGYYPPRGRQDELEPMMTRWGWTLNAPLSQSNGRQRSSRKMAFSFTGLLTSVQRLVEERTKACGSEGISLEERQDMAREVQRLAFEHLASRIFLHLTSVGRSWKGNTIVVSGGVASNEFLRHLLRASLNARGYNHVKLSFPPVELCTDNALMIAWAAIEMYKAGYTSSLDVEPIKKWSMDRTAEDGGILGVGGWVRLGMSIGPKPSQT